MGEDIHVTYMRAKGVGMVWIFAAIAPITLLIGLTERSLGFSVFGGIALLSVLLSVREGLSASKRGVRSDFLAYIVVPSALLVGGIAVAYAAYYRYI